ncbi:MAG TPA: sigma-70 family RNA polymerase sigma factor [Acidimicrobiia bacterium]
MGSTVGQTQAGARFDSLFEAHHTAVFRFCLRRLGPADAEDAAAEVFAVAWRRLDQVPEGEPARAWLLGVAYRVVGNQFRGRRRRWRIADRLRMERSGGWTITASDTQEGIVLEALEQLSGRDRELLRLSAWDGLSRGEIAQLIGIKENAVDQRLHRARSRLRSSFDQLQKEVAQVKPKEASS